MYGISLSQIGSVVNGEKADRRVPWSVLLVIVVSSRDNGLIGRDCTGTVITDEHILTAAHCFCRNGIVGCERKDMVGITTLRHVTTSKKQSFSDDTGKEENVASFPGGFPRGLLVAQGPRGWPAQGGL